jgi:PTH1 family peptidyl-tRNA hydrolase
MFLIVGLGNPGEQYAKTRHNVGFEVVETLARRHGLRFDEKRGKARVAEGRVGGERVALAKPFTYMNLSGQALVALLNWYKLDPSRELLVVFDEFDLPFAALRIRKQGGPGTHNGMRSIVQQLGSQQFPRLRVGIGRPPADWDPANYVLGRWSREQEDALPELLDRAAEAVELLLREGLDAAMNRYNVGESQPKRAAEGG